MNYFSLTETLLLVVVLLQFIVILYYTVPRDPFNVSTFKFYYGQKVKHVLTGGIYKIVGLPDEYVLANTRIPAYAYKMEDGRICVRSQIEMEDGRFIPAHSNICLNDSDDE